jgi:hypothetical protein
MRNAMLAHDQWQAEIKRKDAEIERLQEAKRRALAVADERSKENVGLRAENERLTAALRNLVNATRTGTYTQLAAAAERAQAALDATGEQSTTDDRPNKSG